MIPSRLEDWTLDVVKRLIQDGANEHLRFDFKELATRDDPDAKLRLRKVAASFANAEGGFLVFGVKDKGPRDPEQRIVGTKKEEFQQEFVGGYADKCQPAIPGCRTRSIPLPDQDDWIHVVHIPASDVSPHAVEVCGALAFMKRNDGGGMGPMSFDEVRGRLERQFVDTAAAAALAAECEVLAQWVQKMNHSSPESLRHGMYNPPCPSEKFRPFVPAPRDLDHLKGLRTAFNSRNAHFLTTLAHAAQLLNEVNSIIEELGRSFREMEDAGPAPAVGAGRTPQAQWEDRCDELQRQRDSFLGIRQRLNDRARKARCELWHAVETLKALVRH